MNHAIQVNALSHRYGRKLALDNVSFSVDEGDFFCFLGPNGAGKSTTVKILTGQLALQSGEVIVNRMHIQKNPQDIKNHVGVLTDGMSLPREFTVRELLYFVGRTFNYRSTQAISACEDVLFKTGLKEYATTKIGHLSSGLYRRVGISQALVNTPHILFLDEPTIGLDPIASREILRFIGRLHGEGLTVFYTTHLLKEVEALCTRLAIIENGKVRFCAKISDIKERLGAKIEVEVINLEDNITRARKLFTEEGWDITVQQNTFLIPFPSYDLASLSLHSVVSTLQSRNIGYSKVAIRQFSLEEIYAENISGGNR